MKKIYTAALAALALLVTCGVTSCTTDDDWGPTVPAGWNVFYDSSLNGYWELRQADGAPVYGYAVNYMQFNGGGRGWYYYYDDTYLDRERMAYFCQVSDIGASRYQINIQYEDGGASTMSYWFTGSDLWMQWMASGRTHTYIYRRVNAIP